MEIQKAASVGGLAATLEELGFINQFSLRELSADEVFSFKLSVCDNEIDRDFEVFPRKSLEELAGLLIGKTVILNHSPKAENQVARIYAAQVEEIKGRTTQYGEPYARLIARCYAVRTAGNQDFIIEVEAGIKKEVSVGCSVGRSVCSVCGKERREGSCEHWGGREYEGEICFHRLEQVKDAHEVSFVAVPAQREAGVTKGKQMQTEQHEKPKTNLELLKKIFAKP